MFGMKHKVRAWRDAGLINPAQADAIFAHERESKRGTFGRNLAATGVFAILLGVLSIIAANWYMIPAEVKIGGHLALNAVVGIITWICAARGRTLARELFTLVFFGLSLTVMALTGQVFQLDGSLSLLLITWMVMTLPFIAIFGRTRVTAVLWMIAFLAVITVVMSEYLEPLPQFWQICFLYGVGTLLPLGLLADGSLRLFQRLKPLYAETFTRTGIALLGFNASMASFYWVTPRTHTLVRAIEGVGMDYTHGYLILAGIFMAAVVAIAFHAILRGFYRDNPDQRVGVLFVIVSVLMIAMPVLIPGGEMQIAAAILFIIYWIFIGWIGQMLAWSRLISWAIALVALRILGIYIEIFGDMLSTGVGLIVGGAVVLVLIWAARKMNRVLTPGGMNV